MLEQAELDPSMSKEEFARHEPRLRIALLKKQYEMLDKRDRAVLVVVAGISGAGKGSAINLLNEWMDPRHVHTLAFGDPTEEEAQRPAMWRYWNALPARGQTGVVFGSWYAPLFKEAARKKPDMNRIAAMAAEIQRFEAMLAGERIRVVKLWYHLSRAAQIRRVDDQLADPLESWRASKEDIAVRKKYDRLRDACQIVMDATHLLHAEWRVIPSFDPQVRALATAGAVLDAMSSPLPKVRKVPAQRTRTAARKQAPRKYELEPENGAGPLDGDLYEQRLAQLQRKLAAHVRDKRFRKRSLVLAFEGVDAAGKGGSIRRVSRALDVRQFEITPVSAPTDEELAHPYLWRFWRRLPPHGRVAIFDRSWYGRVLVERVESLIPRATWQRAYAEINDFEEQLHRSGAIVLKFWLSVSKEEQLKRFRERRESPFKSFKLTPDDWRNRRKWDDYLAAARDMLEHTNTRHAPWVVVASNDKRAARVQVLQAIVDALERRAD